MRQVLLLLTCFSLYFTCALAIHCWDCASNINPGCGEPFNNASFAMVDCDQRVMAHLGNKKASICRKIVQKIQENPVPRIVRGCGWIEDDTTDGECVRRAGTYSILVEYCSCRGDGCNGATGLSTSTLTLLPTILVMAIFAFSSKVRIL